MGAIAENRHDEKGPVWPREVSPADVHVVATGKDAEVFEAADRLVADLDGAGVSSIYDDRPKVSPGVKFKDAELLGVPTIIVVGKRLADGVDEVRDRASGASADVPLGDVVAHVAAPVRS